MESDIWGSYYIPGDFKDLGRTDPTSSILRMEEGNLVPFHLTSLPYSTEHQRDLSMKRGSGILKVERR